MVANVAKKKSSRLNRREWMAGYLFLLPNFIGFLVFTGIPVIMGFIISLTDYTGFGSANFVGFDNYLKMFTDSDFKIALQNNLFYSLTDLASVSDEQERERLLAAYPQIVFHDYLNFGHFTAGKTGRSFQELWNLCR